MSAPRIILVFDTALFGCAAAVFDAKTGVCTKEVQPMTRGQAEDLMPMIQDVLRKSGIGFERIDAIGTTAGPGAFTGLRIGLAVARALGLALGKPVHGISTLTALAQQYLRDHKLSGDEVLAVLLETKRQDYYIQLFDSAGRELTGPESEEGEAVRKRLSGQKIIFIGDALERFRQDGAEKNWRFVEGYNLIDPEILARIVADDPSRLLPPEPLYLRPADVSKPKREKRIIGN